MLSGKLSSNVFLKCSLMSNICVKTVRKSFASVPKAWKGTGHDADQGQSRAVGPGHSVGHN